MGEAITSRHFPCVRSAGNFGVLYPRRGISVARAYAAMRVDGSSLKPGAWVVGRNPFVQSTMIGGYYWRSRTRVSGDFSARAVGMGKAR